MRIAAEEEVLLCLRTLRGAFRASSHGFLVLVTESESNCTLHEPARWLIDVVRQREEKKGGR
jgi:hypothetical protein